MIRALIVTALMAAGPAAAQDRTAPRLGAASNFNQGVKPGALAALPGYGIGDLRDGMIWNRAETMRGVYRFDEPRLAYPRAVAKAGMQLSITLNWGNDLYDAGDTPHSAEAIAAFGAFAGVVAKTFPAVDAIEIGNEFNGTNFVKGPLKLMRPEGRAVAYAKILSASYVAAKAVRPDIRVLGGATHSIAAGYIWQVLDGGGAGRMDALAIHPYTTPAEQFVRQVAVLHRNPAAAALPIEITEFGEPDPAKANGYFLRNYCQFALAGVSRAIWYPLTARGDGFVPLFADSGAATSMGRTYLYADRNFVGQSVADVAPDPFTYGCAFGADHIVLWGAPRTVAPAPDVNVLTAEGLPVAPGPILLSRTDPLIFHRPGGIDFARDLGLAPQKVVADSFDQFTYPAADGTTPPGDPFVRLGRARGRDIALQTMPGQQAPGTPWTPYLSPDGTAKLRLMADKMLPAGNAARPVEVVHRYTATVTGPLTLTATFATGARSEDGITVRVTRNGTELVSKAGKALIPIDLPAVPLTAGDVLEVAVGPGANSMGDMVDYRITLTTP